jgi:hypothetical protein
MANTLTGNINDLTMSAYLGLQEYLTASDIRSVGVNRRNRIERSEDNETLKALKTGLSYAREGLEHSVRYSPFVIEGFLISQHSNNEYAPLIWAATALPLRLIDIIASSSRNVFENTIRKEYEGIRILSSNKLTIGDYA